jgi:nicotinamidase-related amidase
VHIRHIATRDGATFFVPGTRGSEIHEAVLPEAGETLFVKHFPNSFRETPLRDHLRGAGIGRLVIAGMMTHMCIDTTTRAAADLGFDCSLAHDACATRALSFGGIEVPAESVQASYLAALSGSFANVLTAAELRNGEL